MLLLIFTTCTLYDSVMRIPESNIACIHVIVHIMHVSCFTVIGALYAIK